MKSIRGAILFLIILGLVACATENDDGATPLQASFSPSITVRLILWTVDTGADRTVRVEESSAVSRLLQRIPDEWGVQVQDDGVAVLPTSDEQGDAFLAKIADLLRAEVSLPEFHLLEVDLDGYELPASKVKIAVPCDPCSWGEFKLCQTDDAPACCSCGK